MELRAPIVIAGFGASSMRGWRPGVNPSQCYRALFEQSLCDAGIPSVVTNAAQPGNTVLGGLQRFERDVLLARPDAVLISFGLNDSALRPDQQRCRVSVMTYREVHEFWLASLKQAKIPTVLMAPQRVADAEANRRLEDYVAVLKELADEHTVPFINAYARMQADVRKGTDLSNIYLDEAHLNPEGNKIIAGLLSAFEQESGFFRAISQKNA